MLSGLLIYRANVSVFDKAWFKALAWAGSLTMALWATFVLISLPVDLIHFLIFIFIKITGGETPLKLIEIVHQVYIFVFGISLFFVAIGFSEVARGARVKKTNISIKNLPKSFVGLKIAQISDLHIGPTIRKSFATTVVSRTNATLPDFIFLTGDIVDSHPQSIPEHIEPLRNLKAKHGVFYVTGNHEYYWNGGAIVEKLEGLGMIPLINENKIIKIGDENVLVSGVTDPAGSYLSTGHKPDINKAFKSEEDSKLKILLSHRPDTYHLAEVLGFDLQFSGHTHAGQFFPFSLFIGLAHKYSRGLYKHGRMWVYVNPGTGYWGPADRLGVSPEISLITITD